MQLKVATPSVRLLLLRDNSIGWLVRLLIFFYILVCIFTTHTVETICGGIKDSGGIFPVAGIWVALSHSMSLLKFIVWL